MHGRHVPCVKLAADKLYTVINDTNAPSIATRFAMSQVTPGLMVELEPLKICTDLREYPSAGEKVECIAHPFGMAKVRIDLWVESVDLEEGVMTFEREAGDGCHGAPIIYNGVCVAVLDQPGIGPKADKARLMNNVLPEKYHDDYDAEKEVMTYDSSRMSKVRVCRSGRVCLSGQHCLTQNGCIF